MYLSYLLKGITFDIDTISPIAHELSKEMVRLTHDHLKVKWKGTKTHSSSSSLFSMNYNAP